MPRFILALAFLLWTHSTARSELKISGSTRFKFGADNMTVTFGCDRINNPSRENATGTIMVRLWALPVPHNGGSISGKSLGEYKLEGLNPGQYYTNVSKTVNASLPSVKKPYVLCITVMEYKGGAYLVADYRNFSGSTTLGPPKTFTMTGPWGWQTSNEGGTIDVNVAKISHTRRSNTGTLKLSVWATDTPYRGGDISGYQLGFVQKEALKSGYSYTNVRNTAKYKRPPAGSYYVSLVLSEYDGSSYKIMEYLPATKATLFK